MVQKELSSGDQGHSRMAELSPNHLKGMGRLTIQKLTAFEQVLLERGEQGLLDWLRKNAQNGINPLAKQIGLNNKTLGKFYDQLGIPRPSLAEVNRRILKAHWQDPDFVERHAEWSRQSLQERRQDEAFQGHRLAGLRKKWEDPDYREARAEFLRRKRLDPDFNDRMNKAIIKARQDPAYKEITRRRRLNPNNIANYTLPTIQGERRDIGFYAQSAWEANIARVLMYCGRAFYSREAFRLSVPPEYQDTFTADITEMSVDFITLDPRGNLQAYEIMAHPAEYSIGWMKLKLLIEQYPYLDVRPIIPKFYRAIRRHFQKRINADSRFAGWETKKDNLRNNPSKYAVENQQ